MIRKIIFTVIALFCLGNIAKAQPVISIGGPNPAAEGTTQYYDISYTNIVSKYNFVSTVTNGTVIEEDLDPASSRIFVKVQWNCGVASGSLRIDDTRSTATTTYNVTITSSVVITSYCMNTVAVHQSLFYGQTPTVLSVIDCNPPCHYLSNYEYTWQVGDVSVGVFPQIPTSYTNAVTGPGSEMIVHTATYQPPTSYVNSIKAYRRKTTFLYQGIQYTVFSNPAIVSFFDHLDPGTISGGSTFLNGAPVIIQTPATGGLCDGYNYTYTWEYSLDNSNWSTAGTGINYPGTLLNASSYVRRRVDCGGEVMYSNVLFVVIPALDPGTISGSGTYSFNTLPGVTQTAASGSVCNSLEYTYTWERSVNNGAWMVFGIGATYPANAGIVGSCNIRRKAKCYFAEGYSNVITFTMSPYTSPNAENLNYIRVNDIVIPGVQSWPQADALPTGDKLQSTTYLDAFGRPIQSVIKQGSLKQSSSPLDPDNINNYQDLVTVNEYDGLGRIDKAYLPYASTTTLGFFKTNAHTEQQSFINQKYAEPINSPYTCSQTTYDGSPLNRTINVKLPGYDWNTDPICKGISNNYDFYNSAVDNVINWEIGFNTGDVPVVATPYDNGTLVKSITKDSKDKLIVEYKDLGGNVILKKVQESNTVAVNSYTGWLNTYYVYDDFGRLRYTITPKAVEQLQLPANNWVITPGIKNGLCFYLEYDKKGRTVVKHSPDGGEVWMVYDNRDRLVFTQDENQRHRTPAKPNQWSFSLYDDNDRNLVTGLVDDNTNNRQAMQDMVDILSTTPQNKAVQIYTGAWETITAYNPVAGKKAGGGYHSLSCTESYTNSVNYYDSYYAMNKPYLRLKPEDFAPTSNLYIEQPEKSIRTKGMATASRTRVLDDKYDNGNVLDNKFLTSVNYVDEKGQIIQTHTDNIKGGHDISSLEYDFAGKTVSTNGKHDAANSIADELIIVTKSDYDLLGRTKNLWKLYTKNIGDIVDINKYKKLSEFTLDEFGSVKTKKIGNDPQNPGNPLEIQDYNYNIQGWLTGINKDYALSTINNTQWDRHFSMYFSYQKDDDKFSTDKQWSGSIRGAIWRSQGDNTPRKYNYQYDNINRFAVAAFTQKEAPADNNWASTKVDLSAIVTGYDANGNIQGMQQTGIVPGTNGGVLIDNLQYQYYDNSNKLKAVIDNVNNGVSGKQGDFKDYSALNSIDYNYDFNGNLKYDKNKAIIDNGDVVATPDPAAGIISNFLDLPQQITIKDKCKTEYIYDASGTKLAKKVTLLIPNAPAPKTTYYAGGFVYEDNDLQYILNEEGRLRIMQPVTGWSGPSGQVNYLETKGNVELDNTTNTWGVWDYFVKDNLSNVRMVLTEEMELQQMQCSMEDAPTTVKDEEERTFGQVDAIGNPIPGANEVQLTRITSPGSWPSHGGNVAKLLGNSTNAIGPNTILKVMAGDELFAMANYHYVAGGPSSNTGIINNIVNSLLQALGSSGNTPQIVHDNVTQANSSYVEGSINDFLYDHHDPNGNINTPRAYLNYIFFDEQFRYVKEKSDAHQVELITSGNHKEGVVTMPITKVPKNGYVYIYLSNESQNIPVYFDDISITHNRAAIVEDNAYYPYGLKIQGISARAAGKQKTKQGYQGDYNEQDEETGYNEFSLRTFDPQVGRWIQIDPKVIAPGMYNGMSNNPVNVTDADGGGITLPPDWYAIDNGDGDYSLVFFKGYHADQLLSDGKTYTRVLASDENSWEAENKARFWARQMFGLGIKARMHDIADGFGNPYGDPITNKHTLREIARPEPGFWQKYMMWAVSTNDPTIKGLAFLDYSIANDAYITQQTIRQHGHGWIRDLNDELVGADARTRSALNTFQLTMSGVNAPIGFMSAEGTVLRAELGVTNEVGTLETELQVTNTSSAEFWIQGETKSSLNTMRKGRYAVESVPGDATRNFGTIRNDINAIGQKYGCHTCGTKTSNGVYIPDHQPSLKLSPEGPFELFPHCPGCSRLQGGQVNKVVNY
jgi:RHS repeat-associated protein